MNREIDLTMLSVKQAAERLNVSCALMYALCAARRIRHERHGLGRGSIRIPEDALNEYRERCTVSMADAEETASVPPPPKQKPITLKHLQLPS